MDPTRPGNRHRSRTARLLVACIVAGGSFLATLVPASAEEARAATSGSELAKDREAIEAGRSRIAELRTQLAGADKAVEEARVTVEAMESDVQAKTAELEKRRKSTSATDSGSVGNYNQKVAELNVEVKAALEKRAELDTLIARHNEILRELREQTKVVNDRIVAYNEKLARKGN